MEFAFGCAVEHGFAWHNEIPQDGTGKGIVVRIAYSSCVLFFEDTFWPTICKICMMQSSYSSPALTTELNFHSPIAQNSESFDIHFCF